MAYNKANWSLIHDARNYADDHATPDDWQNVVDTYIEEHASSVAEADASIEANNIALMRRAGVI